MDAVGDLLIVDSNNQRVRMVDRNGIITTAAGGGVVNYSEGPTPALEANFYYPTGISADRSGNVLIADPFHCEIAKLDATGEVTTIAGQYSSAADLGDGGFATNAYFAFPIGVSVDAQGDIFIADSGANVIRKIDADGFISTIAGIAPPVPDFFPPPPYGGDGGAATLAYMSVPTDVAVDATGNIFIADSANHRVRKVALATSPTLQINDISAAEAGSYTVIVASQFGSVTSAVAQVTVRPPGQNPVITMSPPTLADGNLVLGFTLLQVPVSSLTLLQSENLAGPWATNHEAILTTNSQAGGYQLSLPAPASTAFFELRSP
jgi:hypothetical protein